MYQSSKALSASPRPSQMRVLVFSVAALLMAPSAFSQAVANAPCEEVKQSAINAQNKTVQDIREREIATAKGASQAASCLASAGDGILRAAIPPSLGSIFGVLSDPLGYATSAMTNAACSVITNAAGQVTRGASDISGAVRQAGSNAQGVFTGAVNKTVGSSGDYYPTPKPATDPGFFQTMTCRLFGRC